MLPKILRVLLFFQLHLLVIGTGQAENQKPQQPSYENGDQIDSSRVIDPVDSTGRSQEKIRIDSSTVKIDPATIDSVNLEPALYISGPDTILINAYLPADSAKKHRGSPSLALLRSVVFPGWGQYSNRRYFKAAIVFALESYLIYKAVRFAGKTSDWRAKWKSAPDELKSAYFEKYADYRDTRNTYYWYTGLTIFLSMFDAYVDAHLAGFPESIPEREKLSLKVMPGEETRVTLNYSID